MNYPTRCTHCISLLKNTKKYVNAHYFKMDGEMYIVVHSIREQVRISALEHYQELSFKMYNVLLEIIGEENEL